MLRICLLGGLALGAIGCRYDGTGTKMQWAPDMADAPTVKPQEGYLDPPDSSVTMESMAYPKTAEDAEKALVMPSAIAQDPAAISKGKGLFETFCIACHGATGNGQGTLGPAYPPAADLTNVAYHGRGDGFFFYRITFGNVLMPALGHAISPHERWYIVKYIRQLQQGGGNQ